MNVYKNMMDVIVRREFALLGRYQTREIFKNAGINIDEKGNIRNPDDIEPEDIDKILNELKKQIGFISILVVKLPLRRLAIQNNVKLPKTIL